VGPRPNNVFFIALIIAIALVMLTRNASVVALRRQQYNNRGVIAIRNQRLNTISDVDGTIDLLASIRGGESSVSVEIESSDEEEEAVPTLVKATQKAATKAVKSTVAAALKPKKKKKYSSNLMKYFKIPYIVKASLNPIVFFQMTVGYWKSLYNINYMTEKEQDSSQNLRTALEQKARQGGGGKKKIARKKKDETRSGKDSL